MTRTTASTPTLYERVATQIRDRIARHGMPPGTTLPSATKLSQEYDVDPFRVYRALELLEVQGQVRRLARGRWAVDDPAEHEPLMYRRIADILAAQIEEGTLRAGDLLPSAGVLASEYRVPQAVIRATLRQLEAAGAIVIEHHRGRVTTEKAPVPSC
ncbi:GntR family transcriptional regulator [Nocardiopsis synnemataformans]|uniref:GntR family transcriptional regulator n=1 Tax=Nocardiopsis synnemataformans TaxID=61305 RepID=UPI003EB700B3